MNQNLEPKNIDIYLFLSHLEQLVLAKHLLLQIETIGHELAGEMHPVGHPLT